MAHPIQSATLVGRRDVTETLAVFRLALEEGVPDFEPGQFITLGAPDPARPGKTVWRAYSIASPPSLKGHVELYVRHATEPVAGRVTSALWDMRLGGVIAHRGITGAFTIEWSRPDGTPETRKLLLVAGGTGLAPFLSYAWELAARRTPRDLVLVHGASYVSELAYHEALLALEQDSGLGRHGAFRLRYVPTISRPDEPENAGWTGQTGRAESLLAAGDDGPSRIERLLGVPLTPEEFFVHACGFDGTVKGALAALLPLGFRTHRTRREDGSYDLKFESYG